MEYTELTRAKVITPEEQQRLDAAIAEIAAILYKNTSPEALVNLEEIEKTVRQQMLRHVSPQIAFLVLLGFW